MNDAALVHVHQFVAGCLFGGQLVWTLAVLPTYRHLTPKEYGRLHALLTWYGDLLMPTLGISATMLGFIRYRETGQWTAVVGALALTVASIMASRNLAINVRLRDGDIAGSSDAELIAARKRWAWQHWVRTIGGAVSFVMAMIVPGSVLALGRPGSFPFGVIDVVIAVVLVKSGTEVVGHVRMMLDPVRRARLGRIGTADDLVVGGHGPGEGVVPSGSALAETSH